jgi:hypothetical protein
LYAGLGTVTKTLPLSTINKELWLRSAVTSLEPFSEKWYPKLLERVGTTIAGVIFPH